MLFASGRYEIEAVELPACIFDLEVGMRVADEIRRRQRPRVERHRLAERVLPHAHGPGAGKTVE
jgi:hypothetical protein